MSERKFFRSRFGMNVDEDGRRVTTQSIIPQQFVESKSRVVDIVHKHPSQNLSNQYFFAVQKFKFCKTASGSAVGIVKRPDNPFVFIQKRDNVALLPNVVAGGQKIGAAFQKLAGDSGRDAKTVSRVFDIDDNYVGFIFFPHQRQVMQNGVSAGASDHVSAINNFQCSLRQLKKLRLPELEI